MNVRWTKELLEYVKNNAAFLHDAEIAARLSKITGEIFTLQAVRTVRQKTCGIKKAQGRGYNEIEATRPPGGRLGLIIHGDSEALG